MEEGDELWRFIKLWVTVILSLTYCYFISKNIPKGFLRLLSILPIISIFTYLPLSLSSIHLTGSTGFFIGWLANFKLLLFSFGKGPLSSSSSDPNSTISLRLFISIACFPIKIKNNKQNPSHDDHQIQINKPKSNLYYATQALLLALLLRVYVYKEYLHPNFILFLYSFHMYFSLEILLAMGAALARLVLGLELEPQFYDPYLSTSLQDFWGKRWNLMVTGVLRPTVYEPVRPIFTRIFGRNFGLAMALVSTFVVSGVMHELMFFYMSRILPTWEVLWFFVLHGLCLAVEIAFKKRLRGKCQLPRLISGPLTIGFVAVTSFWLFFPIFGRFNAEVRANEEIAAFVEFVKSVTRKSLVYLQLQV